MTGKLYSSSENAVHAFENKNLFNRIIVFNENAPSEKDCEEGAELYKLFHMAYYYMWQDYGILKLKPLKTTVFSGFLSKNSYLSFRVNKESQYYGSINWIIETNANNMSLDPVIDLMAAKLQQMIEQYGKTHSRTESDFLNQKIAGILNRHMPLSISSLSGEWIASDVEGEPWPILTDKESIENQLLTPAYSLSFSNNNECVLGGGVYDAVQAKGTYYSSSNIIIGNNRNVLAYVVKLEENVLTVIMRYRGNPYGELFLNNDGELIVINYRRVLDLKRELKTL